MKYRLFYSLLFWIFLMFIFHTRIIATDKKLPISRGVNMGNALEAPVEGQWGVIIKDEYFKLIKNAGFDHVRIPVRWSAHADPKPPYTIETSFFNRVDHVINEALKNGLYVVLNIHHYEEMMQRPEQHKDRFLEIWKQLSIRYKDYPETLWFELLNEPCNYLNSRIWNQYLREAINIIRKTNPTRKIIVGPTDWNSIYKLNELEIPKDSNIVVTFHYYNPFQFTHQGAEWVSPSPPVGTKWLGTAIEKLIISGELDMAVEWSKKNNNIPLFLGEFGAYSKADMDSRVRWTSYVARSAEQRGIAWCYWEFCAGFGIYDPVRNEWKTPLLRALIPEK